MFFFSSRRRHTRCALVTGVQTCALPICLRDWPFRLRDAAALESLRWSTTRRRVHQNLTVLAVDHRSQFEDLAAELGVGLDRVACFKRLALDALDRVAGDSDEFGILLDGRFGADALAAAADRPYWIGRPTERPRPRPPGFEGGASLARSEEHTSEIQSLM